MIVDDEREERDRLVSWIYLIVAGLLEIGWPVGLKMSQEAETRVMGILLAVGFMAASGFCLWMAQKQFQLNGVRCGQEPRRGHIFSGCYVLWRPSSLARYFGVALIVAGVVVLKLAH